MSDEQLKTLLNLLNYTLGIIISLFSIKLYTKRELTAPLYITCAIIVAGPIENLLMSMVSPKEWWIVDGITSILFLIFLLLAVLDLANASKATVPNTILPLFR